LDGQRLLIGGVFLLLLDQLEMLEMVGENLEPLGLIEAKEPRFELFQLLKLGLRRDDWGLMLPISC